MLDSEFGFENMRLAELGAGATAREIAQQPAVWDQVLTLVRQREHEIALFLKPLFANPELEIILTGAGTSAFIGQCLAPAILRKMKGRIVAVATTDLVSGPDSYFSKNTPTLLVSFARSGSSPESVAALELADQIVGTTCHHLIFTCNKNGELHRLYESQNNALSIVLPEETHDRAFAMTSSFSSMLLSGATVFGVIEPRNYGRYSAAGEDVMKRAPSVVDVLAQSGFERVVYLGSNELAGLAREASLKLLELSDGQIVGCFDSPLGFRHGPKTLINEKTLVVVLVSNNSYTRQYDIDLLREVRRDGKAAGVLALAANTVNLPAHEDNFIVSHLADATDLELVLVYAVFAQIFALLQSLRLGIRSDTPSVSGTVNRVVQGVTIYDWKG